MRKFSFAVFCSLFIFCANYAALGRAKFDAEDVIDHSSPYKRTAERSSAAKKPHIKMEKPVDFFDGFQPFISVLKN